MSKLIRNLVILTLTVASLSAHALSSLNVTSFGAKGDARQVWAHTTSNSVAVGFTNTLSAAAIGKAIELFAVGRKRIGNNITGVWSTNYQDMIAVITNVSGNTAYISGDVPQVTSNGVYCIYGTDNSASFQAAINAASGTNTIINIPAGTFLMLPAIQYTNFVPNPDFFIPLDAGFAIHGGGLSFVGADRDSTVLMGDGAWKQQSGSWVYNYAPKQTNYAQICLRGFIFTVQGPITNNYPIVFTNLTFDGGLPVGHNGYGASEYANAFDGRGWDGSSAASVDLGSDPLPVLKTFARCKFQHFRGEMLKGLTGTDGGGADTVVTNCIFTDGNATAFNYNTSHTITGCTFSNMYQVEEFYLKYSDVRPSRFINNYVTNMEHNVISLNGGTLTNQPYVISNNLMYVNFSGNVIATCPAANVTVCSNRLLNTGSYNYIAFVIGQSGAQAGSPDACNTNIVIYGNYVSNSAKALWLNGGSGYDDPARIDGVKFYNNTLVGQQWLTFVWTQNWVTNCNVYSNDLSGQSGGVKFETDNILASYSDVSTNNNYWGTIILNGEWGPTNAISYGGGSRYRMTYPYSASVPNYLVTADAGHIPSDAAIVITNAAYSGASVPVYFDQTMTSSVTLTNTQVTTFYWNGSTWTTNPTSRPSPPTDLQVGLGLP